MTKSALMVGIALCLSIIVSCRREKSTSVTVSSGPSFSFNGSGRLAVFTVYAPLPGQRIATGHPDVASIVWQIRPEKGYFEGAHVEGLRLTYGEIPANYKQDLPPLPKAALQLPSGAVYSFFAETSDAPAVGGFFYMDKTGPIPIVVPDLCLLLENGREVRVNCRTKEPYQEPSNLEEMVQRNRIRK